MTETDFVGYMNQGLLLVLLLSMPPIIVASVVGVIFSLLQALTQIQEQTLSFAVKLIAVGITMLLSARWIGGEIFNYAVVLFEAFPYTGR
ncbi:type III secretion system export apparatus subunit SctS [Pseudothauera rhizosphaerae]|uniref:EscS/YscS/HrcS family type III secretion system export apparatus protein n=1 Tax=Pseudothauera rhizosphaerae TaxID=2565932 RepID=A0A4S4ADV6_9RHOO|nr:type III secretion system export apparatus subunit SctS [Pseudothauera rhizosphaerae]THF57263.1 EscS/YscS/HrcS family type III secretion system export apparatus protein [Pseudothauera rhizosphaerae]